MGHGTATKKKATGNAACRNQAFAAGQIYGVERQPDDFQPSSHCRGRHSGVAASTSRVGRKRKARNIAEMRKAESGNGKAACEVIGATSRAKESWN